MLHQVRPNSVLPDFCHGTLRDIFRGQLIKSKPLFLYLSGDDHTSKHFETQILTMPEIIVLMNDNFVCLGLNATSHDGQSAQRHFQQQIVPAVLIIVKDSQENIFDIRFSIEGANLTDQSGGEFFEFLSQVIKALEEEAKEKRVETSSRQQQQRLEERKTDASSGMAMSSQQRVGDTNHDEDFLMAQRLQEELFSEEQYQLPQVPSQIYQPIDQESSRVVVHDFTNKVSTEQVSSLPKPDMKALANQERDKQLEEKKLRLGDEPESGAEGVVQIVFRKPSGNERIQRRFLKTDLIQKLYDFIDLKTHEDVDKLGFEVNEENKDAEIKYEIVTAPQPQIKKLNNIDTTLEGEGITRSTLLNIKQLQ
ncbi:hypothetical protein FGO68_gene13535 [Halteria grandinella]|uniref:UBX domain-containing protein n=1 Tax=Halteria grandinella TaxID=5974 RepID=A0A8J8NTZ1_HALGN|nr:hypothetical protein FGO68_gene13535 [Halteria grandinella]